MTDCEIERVLPENYAMFDDMVFRREHGYEREPSRAPVPEPIRRALADPDLYVYAVRADRRYVGWISLLYLPKVGKWNGHGHIYVDELWVAPEYRGQGLGTLLMRKADELGAEREASGVRLYVNVNNPAARRLYERCGYGESGQAYLMEKKL